MRWIDIKSDEFPAAVEASKGVCVIPIGCVERHGTHMPLGCDTIACAEYARRAAEIASVCVFPEMYFGEKSGAGEFPGTIIFPTPLIWAILEQSCNEIARNGFKKIVLFNGHGGNTAMLNAFARYMLQKKPNYMVFVYGEPMAHVPSILSQIEKYPYLTEEDIAILQDYVDKKKKDGHGGFLETGSLYDVCPELIDLNKFGQVDGTSVHRLSDMEKYGIYSPFGWMADYPNSLHCDYHGGMNARIAKAMGQWKTEKCATAFEFVRQDAATEEYYNEWIAKQ